MPAQGKRRHQESKKDSIEHVAEDNGAVEPTPSSNIKTQGQPAPQGQRDAGVRRSERIKENLEQKRLRLREKEEESRLAEERLSQRKQTKTQPKKQPKKVAEKASATSLTKPAPGRPPAAAKKKDAQTQKDVGTASHPRPRGRPPAAASKRQGTSRTPNKKEQQQQQGQAPAQSSHPHSHVSHWLGTRMPRKNPRLPTEPSAQRQAQQTSGNADPSERPEASVVAPTATTNATTKISNDELGFYLVARNASLSSTARDWWTPLLREDIKRYSKFRPTIRAVSGLISLARDFADQNSNLEDTTAPEALSKIVETFHRNLCEKLYESGSHSINEFDFNMDLNQARERNEYFFQHTVMMHSTDRWRFNETFTCSCHQCWHKDAPRLPLKKNAKSDTNAAPRFYPDLTISFQASAVRGGGGDEMPPFGKSEKIMSHLAVFPEGPITRCFPFVAIEAKKENGDMQRAKYTSHYVATRSLYNICLCMRRVKKIAEFFKYVRTFSINMGPTHFEARIHRAVWDTENDEPKFVYEVLTSQKDYTRNKIGALIRVIVVEYAQKILLPLLQNVYKTLTETGGSATEVDNEMSAAWNAFSPTVKDFTEADLRGQLAKRPADEELASSPKRSHGAAGAQQPSETLPSFMTDAMSLGESQQSGYSQEAMVHG